MLVSIRLEILSACALVFSPLCASQVTHPDRQTSKFNSYSGFDVDCNEKPRDYPVGIYLGPNRLTSAYYTADDVPVTIADVPADADWHTRSLKGMLEGRGSCWYDGTVNRDEEEGPCAAILPSFLANMKKLNTATAEFLGRDFQIGFVVIPNNLKDYIGIIDKFMHIAFNFTHNPKPDDDLIIYDVFELPFGNQYGYNFNDPGERYGSRVPLRNRDGPPFSDFNDDDYLIYVNIEDEFLEIAFHCLTYWCWAPKTRKIVAYPGRDSTETLLTSQPADATAEHQQENTWLVQAPLSVEFGMTVGRIARHISDFLYETGYTGEDGGVLRGVVLSGGASANLTAAAAMALPRAMPGVDRSMFLTTRDPAFVPSLGAALMARNLVAQARRELEIGFCGVII